MKPNEVRALVKAVELIAASLDRLADVAEQTVLEDLLLIRKRHKIKIKQREEKS